MNGEENTTKVAVRCDKCKKILAFKLGTASGFLQLKCPVCKAEIRVDLSLRRVKGMIHCRKANYPLTIAFH
jgi:phage FluMu protein Com